MSARNRRRNPGRPPRPAWAADLPGWFVPAFEPPWGVLVMASQRVGGHHTASTPDEDVCSCTFRCGTGNGHLALREHIIDTGLNVAEPDPARAEVRKTIRQLVLSIPVDARVLDPSRPTWGVLLAHAEASAKAGPPGTLGR